MEKIYEKIKNYKNIPLIIFIFYGILSDLLLRALTLGNIFGLRPLIANIGVLLLLSVIPLLLVNEKRGKIFTFLSLFIGIISLINYLYYKHFDSYVSLSLIRQIHFVFEMDGSVRSTFDFKMFLFLLPPMGYILSIRKLNKLGYFYNIGKSSMKKDFFRPIGIGLLCIALVTATLTRSDFSRLAKQWNRPYLVEHLGLFSYTLADVIKSILGPNAAVAQMDAHEAEDQVDKLVDANVNERIDSTNQTYKYKDIFKDRDVYIIHFESAQSFAMDLDFAHGNVTPFLNKLADEGLNFKNFYPQHSVGTSSDSEFSFNTSLYPVNNGAIFMSHFDREFVSLQNLLTSKGYYSVSMHGNNGDFWNRNIMHKTLGYDYFFSMKDYTIDEEIGLGLSDESFYKQSVEKIKELKNDHEKLVATMISLTNHYPFDEVDKYGEFDVGHMEGTILGNYFKSYNYADRALESLVSLMDKEGLLDNAILVIYGDHHAQISISDYEKLHNYNPLTDEFYDELDIKYMEIDEVDKLKIKRTPFIVWTKDQAIKDQVATPMGMVDAMPTLGNMLGIFNEYQLGNDIMNYENNTVIFPDSSWVNEKYYYSASSATYYDINGNEVEASQELLEITEETEEDLLLSNEIVNSNLIKSHKKNAHNEHLIE